MDASLECLGKPQIPYMVSYGSFDHLQQENINPIGLGHKVANPDRLSVRRYKLTTIDEFFALATFC